MKILHAHNYYRLPIYGVYVYYSGQHSTTETAVAATVLRKMMIQGGNGVFIVKNTTAQKQHQCMLR
jgi:hypothetical protein